MRSLDWTTTPLGKSADWPESLRSMLRMILNSRYQMWMGWGEQLTFFCNDAYRPTLGVKFPAAIGRPAREVWAEVWADVTPLVDQALTQGEATYAEAMLLFLERSGFPEETYHTFSYSPLFDNDGVIAGLFCVVVEDTERVINERRMATLRDVASAAARSTGEQALFAAIGIELERNGRDLPFALLYRIEERGARLIARAGIGADHPAAPARLERAGSVWPLGELLDNGAPVLVEDVTQLAPLPAGAWHAPPKRGLLVPITTQPGEPPTALMVVGLSPVQRLDEAACGFFELLAGQIGAAMATQAILASEREAMVSRERLDVALSIGQIAIFDYDPVTGLATVLGPLVAAFAVSAEEGSGGLPLDRFLAGIHADDRDRVRAAIGDAVARGGDYQAEYGTNSGQRVLARGRLSGERLIGAVIDMTEQKLAEDTLRDKTAALELVNRTGAALAADLEPSELVQRVVDAGVAMIGAEFGAFFYNSVNAPDDVYQLYALSSGAPEAFANLPMPRNTPLFRPTYAGEGVVRSDDLRTDPRYGGHRGAGLPDGHPPVRSYLAVPVKSRDGSVIGGLLFGHSSPARFGRDGEELLDGLAAQAAVAIDNARLLAAANREIAQRRKAEADLHRLNSELEERVTTEVAERMKAEEALRQAQKMEAVGQLTGGVAHDFNNLLTVILGGLDTARRVGAADDARLGRALAMATQGAQRAATLTARLLAFSRRTPLAPQPLDLNGTVRDATELLFRALGENIELECVLAPRLWTVEADRSELESAILNLAVNARDAMPSGGKLTIETANAMLDEGYTAVDSEVVPGQYAMLSVTDSGTGIPEDVINRVFEPFYTTKEVGRGTGLGLSQVYGFVKQSGGHVTIYSEVGQGTTVKLYFPRFFGSVPAEPPAPAVGIPTGRRDEVVLVVEDNAEVRGYSVMSLTELGYQVIEAGDAEVALDILRRSDRIDLLFTDVILPGKTGRMLADEAAQLRPGLKVLFTTGYSRNAIVHQGRLDPGVQLLTKPFTFEQLANRLRDMLDR